MASAIQVSEACRLAPGTAGVPAKLQVVRQDQVRQPVTVTLKLLALLNVIQVGVQVLTLDVSDWDAALLDDEVRRAAGHVRRLVEGADSPAAQYLNERLQRRTVGVLRGLSAGACLCHFSAVRAESASCCLVRHGASTLHYSG